MGSDTTENVRREMVKELNAAPKGRAELELKHGQVWNTQELGRDYEVIGFLAPFVMVRRRSDGIVGSLMFQHAPRFYFNFLTD
jgi:hypothetical protein